MAGIHAPPYSKSSFYATAHNRFSAVYRQHASLHLHAEWNTQYTIFLDFKVHSNSCLVIPLKYISTVPT